MTKKCKYIIFSPYFGKLPQNFQLWLQSCQYNEDFLFIIFTDCNYTKWLPQNVVLKHISFAELQQLVQSKFDFPISLQTPYKLCDYKPAFGYLFQEYLGNTCSYWGHCDMDLIFGKLKTFLPIANYDKIAYLGHFSLYRNTDEMRYAFKFPSESAITFKDVFASDIHFAFDEAYQYGINAILRANHKTIYPFQPYVADISGLREDFAISVYQHPGFTRQINKRIFSYEDGRVYAHTLGKGETIEKKEFAYIHLQKRVMTNMLSGTPSRYLIVPNAFKPWQEITPNLIRQLQPKFLYWKQIKRWLTTRKQSLSRSIRRRVALKKFYH